MEKVVLVNEKDQDIGEMEKIQAHLNGGYLHRAFSGFVFNEKNELLIQKRASHKYHNPDIWANTVCSHPQKNETVPQAAKRRLNEELGFSADFTFVGKFIYKAAFPNGLTEYEYDNVCVAKYDGSQIIPNPEEVDKVRFITKNQLEQEIQTNPESFSFWLREILRLNFLKDW